MKRKKLFIGGGIVLAVVAIELVLYFFTGAFGRTAIRTLRNRDKSADGIHTAYYLSQRGKILDCKGRVIAANKIIWDVHLDCMVLDVPESEWESLSEDLSVRLEEILCEKTAGEYFEMLMSGRAGHKRYLKICENVEDSVATSLMQAPILNMERYKGGRIFTAHHVRGYSFGGLGLQTIGHSHPKYSTGIEGAYNDVLRGDTSVHEYVVRLRRGKYVSREISHYEADDGQDVTSTLDMDLMAVCDSELRTVLKGSWDVKYVCAVLTEAKSGAVRAMVNLAAVPNEEGCFMELNNIAVGKIYEPGEVLTQLPSGVLEKGLGKMTFDFRWLPDAAVRVSGNDGGVRVFCTPLYVSRVFGGIANGGVMFDPYLVTPSSSSVLCSPAVADSLKAVLKEGCASDMLVAHSCAEGEDPYRYPSGKRVFSTTWAGFFTAGGTEYTLVTAAFSDRTIAYAPQKGIPEKAAKGIMKMLSDN